MSERKPREMLLVVLAVLVLGGLCAWPATRWIVRLQLVQPLLPSFLNNREAQARSVAEENPRDYSVQLARALTLPTPNNVPYQSEARVQRLHELAARFPNEPSLYAHTLRYATQGQVIVHRSEQDELSAAPPAASRAMPKLATAENLAAFDNDAANGERLDPDNAYFPLLRAAGLFEAHRDAEAVAAIHRAGQKTRYEDYSNSEFAALDNFSKLAHGENGSMARIASAASLLFPQYAQIRAVARMGTVSAVHAELGGKAEEGFAIRHDLMRAGALMRVQGHTIICNLVGIAVTVIPTARPGGAPAVKAPDNQTQAQREQRARDNQEKYFAYLRGIGHAEDVKWAQAEFEAGRQAKQVANKVGEVGPFSTSALCWTCFWWAADLLTMTNAIGLLILGAAAALAAAVRPKTRLMLWRGVLTLATLALFGLWLFNVERNITDWVTTPLQMTQAVSDMQGGESNYGGLEAKGRVVALCLALALPIGMSILILGISISSKVPFTTGLGRGLRGLALPVACVLCLLYGALLMGTVRHEKQMNAAVEGITTNEGAYTASQSGQTWPGPTPTH